jgi:hypothetical protein
VPAAGSAGVAGVVPDGVVAGGAAAGSCAWASAIPAPNVRGKAASISLIVLIGSPFVVGEQASKSARTRALERMFARFAA